MHSQDNFELLLPIQNQKLILSSMQAALVDPLCSHQSAIVRSINLSSLVFKDREVREKFPSLW